MQYKQPYLINIRPSLCLYNTTFFHSSGSCIVINICIPYSVFAYIYINNLILFGFLTKITNIFLIFSLKINVYSHYYYY